MEKTVENNLRIAVKKRSGICLKFTSPGTDGVPDRIVLMPNGRIFFVELKDKGKKPSKIQLYVHEMIRKLGFKVFVIDSNESLKTFIILLENI